MQIRLQQLKQTVLFYTMTEEEIRSAIRGLHARERSYPKGSYLFRAGEITKCMGLILSGCATIESNDIWGNRTILSHLEDGDFFAETYALLKDEPMLVDVVAKEDCEVLFFDLSPLHAPLHQPEMWKIKVMSNLLTISSRKSLTLSGRSFHTSARTIRGRVMSYLNSVSLQKQSREFDIPFDRQQLADYLNLERSALSKELGKMQREGILKTRKNHFVIQIHELL